VGEALIPKRSIGLANPGTEVVVVDSDALFGKFLATDGVGQELGTLEDVEDVLFQQSPDL
jgi:hypothetical protein